MTYRIALVVLPSIEKKFDKNNLQTLLVELVDSSASDNLLPTVHPVAELI
jgi:hypothetical protein